MHEPNGFICYCRIEVIYMLYPMKFKPVYKEYIWGGNRMKQSYGRVLPSDCTAESWDVACHANGMSIVANGPLKGLPLEALFAYYKEPLLGKGAAKYEKFPLLVKIIDAKDRLSLQVHPTDDYAAVYENGELGKNEMWYVLHAEQGAKLACGLKDGVTKEDFVKGIEECNLQDYINEIPVEAGDVINIPAGLVHAIEEGIMIAEVQQNSDTVYRVHDWNRVGKGGKPREIHVDKALEVIDFDHRIPKVKTEGETATVGNNKLTHYISNDYFLIDKLELLGIYNDSTNEEQMAILICLEGNFNVNWTDMVLRVNAGESVLIPASVGDYQLFGQGSILRASLPTVDTEPAKRKILTDVDNIIY